MSDTHADAPGRVNLIGEHTDYQDGFVLPCAIPQRTRVVLRRREDPAVHAFSEELNSTRDYVLGEEARTGSWIDYVQALTWVLARESLPLGGFDLRIRSDVPVGSGLSSSAALEIAVLRAVRAAFTLDLSDVALARLAQRAEVEFVGAPVGIMDQMACSLATEREALFLDTRTLEFERIPLPGELDLVVIDSGVAHQHAGGDYVTRRRESEEAARELGVDKLRDVNASALSRMDALSPVLARRARHVITENCRVLEAADALKRGDLIALGRLFQQSHASLRDDYEVSVPAVDTLVRLAQERSSVFGARMTGGGFGGAVVIAVATPNGRRVAHEVSDAYVRYTDRRATILVPAES